jgi:hypothetical protein
MRYTEGVVGKKFLHFGIAAALAAAVFWAQCALCTEGQAPQTPQHDCCKKANAGHCGRTAPAPVNKECPKKSARLESYDKTDSDLARLTQPAAGVAWVVLSTAPQATRTVESELALAFVIHPPPDLLALTSNLRI